MLNNTRSKVWLFAVLGTVLIGTSASAAHNKRYDAPNKCPKAGTNCTIIVFPGGTTGIDVAGSAEPVGW